MRWFEWDVPESSEKHQVDLKSFEKMLTQLEDVGQQLAMTFSTDGSAFAVGGEKHKKVEDINLKGIRVWQRKRMGKIQLVAINMGFQVTALLGLQQTTSSTSRNRWRTMNKIRSCHH